MGGRQPPVDLRRQVGLCLGPLLPHGSEQAPGRPGDGNSPCGFPRLVMNEPRASKAP